LLAKCAKQENGQGPSTAAANKRKFDKNIAYLVRVSEEANLYFKSSKSK